MRAHPKLCSKDPENCTTYVHAQCVCYWFRCRRIWRKLDVLKSGGGHTAGSGIYDDYDEDESAKWSWYIS